MEKTDPGSWGRIAWLRLATVNTPLLYAGQVCANPIRHLSLTNQDLVITPSTPNATTPFVYVTKEIPISNTEILNISDTENALNIYLQAIFHCFVHFWRKVVGISNLPCFVSYSVIRA